MDEYIAFEHPEEVEYMTVRLWGTSLPGCVCRSFLMCVLSHSTTGSAIVMDMAWTAQIKNQAMSCGFSAGGQELEQEFSAFL